MAENTAYFGYFGVTMDVSCPIIFRVRQKCEFLKCHVKARTVSKKDVALFRLRYYSPGGFTLYFPLKYSNAYQVRV